jgi:hypothetical protein
MARLSNLPDFKYEPLADGVDTRVLILHPGTGEDDIYCTLEPIKLTENSDFEALSYVWGDISQSRNVHCTNEPNRNDEGRSVLNPVGVYRDCLDK